MYTLSDLRRDHAEYEREMADIEERHRGRYSNVPTESERILEKMREEAHKADVEIWKKYILPGIIRRGYAETY